MRPAETITYEYEKETNVVCIVINPGESTSNFNNLTFLKPTEVAVDSPPSSIQCTLDLTFY